MNSQQEFPSKFTTLSPFRYPGGKSLLRPKVIRWIKDIGYRPKVFLEPFAGGASVSLAIAELNLADKIILVENDPEVSAVWKCILSKNFKKFIERIKKFELNQFSVWEVLNDPPSDEIERAFRCLLRNRVSRGGIMAPGAGLLNRGEKGKGLSSRWYPETIAQRIQAIHELRHQIQFKEGDGLRVLNAHRTSDHVATFIDPPYTAKGRGAGLRLYSQNTIDIDRLFNIAKTFKGSLMITYHRSDIVTRLAKNADIDCHTVGVRTAHGKVKRELIMFRGRLSAGTKSPE